MDDRDAAAANWATIMELYICTPPTPVIALNRALAIFRDGPTAGLEAFNSLADAPELARYHLMAAARADFLHQTGRTEEALSAYSRRL